MEEVVGVQLWSSAMVEMRGLRRGVGRRIVICGGGFGASSERGGWELMGKSEVGYPVELCGWWGVRAGGYD